MDNIQYDDYENVYHIRQCVIDFYNEIIQIGFEVIILRLLF